MAATATEKALRRALRLLIDRVRGVAECYPDPEGLPECADGDAEVAWDLVATAIENAEAELAKEAQA